MHVPIGPVLRVVPPDQGGAFAVAGALLGLPLDLAELVERVDLDWDVLATNFDLLRELLKRLVGVHRADLGNPLHRDQAERTAGRSRESPKGNRADHVTENRVTGRALVIVE